MYPTAEEIRAAVQAAHPQINVTVTEASNGAGGPVYAVAFAEHEQVADGAQ